MSDLIQRIPNTEKSIAFIQSEHAMMLRYLHEEIAKWQEKCRDLTFQLAIKGIDIRPLADQSDLYGKIEQYEEELRQSKEKIRTLNQMIDEKEKARQTYENRLIRSNRRHGLELYLEHCKQQNLRTKLDQQTIVIGQLTNQLYLQRRNSTGAQARLRSESRHSIETECFPLHRRLSSRSMFEDESTKILFLARRPPTPPQRLGSSSLLSKNCQTNEETEKPFRRTTKKIPLKKLITPFDLNER